MKTPEEWISEYSQSGPFDLISTTPEAIAFLTLVQEDAAACAEADLLEHLDYERG